LLCPFLGFQAKLANYIKSRAASRNQAWVLKKLEGLDRASN
jgi:hypothetical protein